MKRSAGQAGRAHPFGSYPSRFEYSIAHRRCCTAIRLTWRVGQNSDINRRMPYEEHPELNTPSDETVIWRYMDFAKFVQLLEHRALWFTRADRFEDPLEGLWTDAELDHLKTLAQPANAPPWSLTPSQGFLAYAQLTRHSVYVNCWRASSGESLAMWDLYGKGNGILAVKSTVGILKQQFVSTGRPIYLAGVRYVDWSTAPWNNNALVMCARKEASYQHESELRAIIWDVENMTGSICDNAQCSHPHCLQISVDPASLISEVVAGPREQEWVLPLVKSVLLRYGCSIQVTSSDRLKKRF